MPHEPVLDDHHLAPGERHTSSNAQQQVPSSLTLFCPPHLIRTSLAVPGHNSYYKMSIKRECDLSPSTSATPPSTPSPKQSKASSKSASPKKTPGSSGGDKKMGAVDR